MAAADLMHPNRLVVGLDGSAAGRTALDWAARAAAARAIPLHLVHVIETEAGRGIGLRIQQGAEALVAAGVAEARDAGVPADRVTGEHRQGRPWEVVTEIASDPRDLIVIGTRGEGAYHRHLLGSTADRIVRLARCAVLTLPPDGVPGGGVITRAVVGVDFSDDSDAALDAAAAIVGEGGTVIAVHASPPPVVVSDGPVTPLPDVDVDAMLADAKAGLEQRLAERVPAGIERVAVASPLYPVHAIEDAVREHDAQLVAVGTRGRTGLARLLLGSVSERVLHHVPCPTLVVHADRDGSGDAA